MTNIYQYNASGYFVGEVEDYDLVPNNATRIAPKEKEGHIPKWDGKKWEQIENHKDEEGYVNGEPYTIKEYGALPEGWSESPPEATPEELAEQRKAEIQARLSELDLASIRPLRAVAEGVATDYDKEKVATIEAEIVKLRAELAAFSRPEAIN